VAVVPFPATPAGQPVDVVGVDVAYAVDRYLDSVKAPTTRASYAETLARLTAAAGQRDTGTLQPGDYATVMERWDGAAAATWNRHLSALTSFTAWAQRNEILAANPARRLERRKPARRGDRSIPRARLEKLFADDKRGLRERVLWRMLYETAARADEILTLNVEDLDPEFRRARVTSKGGAVEYVHWATGTARILPRLLRGRTAGPVFLADRRAPASGPRAPSAEDTCPATGRGRLSYPRAEYLFKQASKAVDPHKKGWTLHQLRHSALQHLAADGRTAPELQAKSRHQHLASLGSYVRLGTETAARITAANDPANRRKSTPT
jgi:integrase